MKVVQAGKTLRVPAEKGSATLILRAGERYVMHDDEAAAGLAAGAIGVVGEPGPPPEKFDFTRHGPAEAVFPFVGGYGDAVSCIPVLKALRRHAPSVRLTVATTPGPREIFTLAGIEAHFEPYPLTERAFARFDALLSMEEVPRLGLARKQSRPDSTCPIGPEGFPAFFAEALGVPFEPEDLAFALRPPPLPKGSIDAAFRPRIGLAVSPGSALREWPIPQQALCIRELVLSGASCFLLGLSSGPVNWPDNRPTVYNLVGKTRSISDLASWTAGMDAMVVADSFLMHLSGALGIPTVAVFGPTSGHHAGAYSSVLAMCGQAPCAPCGQAVGPCPKGHPACLAMQAENVAGPAVAREALALAGISTHT